MLTESSQTSLDTRVQRGNKSIRGSWGYAPQHPEDRESAAKDAISDILTALFGPAGKLVDDVGGRCKVELDREAVENASALIDEALQSYFGDAEDYVEAEEPTKAVALVDVVVIRDPDASNDISVLGGEANVVDIDLGAMDLNDPEEWSEWIESRKSDFDSVATKDAQAIIAEAVSTAADCFGHDAPEWTK